MSNARRTAKSAPWLVAALLAASLCTAPGSGAVAQEHRSSPWFGSGGLRAIPFGRPHPSARREMRREAPFIRHLYRGFLGRGPSEQEVRYWVGKMGDEIGATGMVREFLESDEFFVRQTYLGLLRREPDPGGMETFMRALRQGASRADVVESILRSEEFERALR